MALVVGTDTYLSMADADEYVDENLTSTDAKYIVWKALTKSDAEVLLRKSARIIDMQPVQGYKVSSIQTMSFPRVMWTDAVNGFTQYDVPDAVKYAQVEIALSLAQGNSEERSDLQAQGVKAFSLGNLSETYAGKSGGVISQRAKELLAPFLGGGFRI